MKDDEMYIYGRHAVLEALREMPKTVKRVLYEAGKSDDEIKSAARKAGIAIDGFPKGQEPRGMERDVVHQGIVALVTVSELLKPYKEFIESLEVTPDTALVLFGEVHDPHNVGAVIRSAAAFGIKGILIPEHNQAPVTGTVVKVSAGMAFRVPLIQIGNVNTVIEDLKARGFWIYGLEGDAKQSVTKEEFEKPSVFILGNEAKGIRTKTREHCDILLSIPTHEQTESLNASASASVALYAWSVKHPKAIK